MRCTTYVGDADFEFGWRRCTRCRPPWDIVARRARKYAGMVMAGVAQLHLDPRLDPPLDPEATQAQAPTDTGHGRIATPCAGVLATVVSTGYIATHDTPEARQRRFEDDVEQPMRMSPSSSWVEGPLTWQCGRSLLCGTHLEHGGRVCEHRDSHRPQHLRLGCSIVWGILFRIKKVL